MKQTWNFALQVWTQGKAKSIWVNVLAVMIGVSLLSVIDLIFFTHNHDMAGNWHHLSIMRINGGIFGGLFPTLFTSRFSGKPRLKLRTMFWQLLPVSKRTFCLIRVFPVGFFAFMCVLGSWYAHKFQPLDARVNLTVMESGKREQQIERYKGLFPGAELIQVKEAEKNELQQVVILPQAKIGQILFNIFLLVIFVFIPFLIGVFYLPTFRDTILNISLCIFFICCMIGTLAFPEIIGYSNYEALVSLAVLHQYAFLFVLSLLTMGSSYLVAHFLQYREL